MSPPCASSSRWAHPRACGENPSHGRVLAEHQGSSPRVRGKPHCIPPPTPRTRLIPARAGKTCGPRRTAGRRGAHPRACGENEVPVGPSAHPRGSSPRVRGKRGLRSVQNGYKRLIPARAGKTRRCRGSARGRWAHPRACGENSNPKTGPVKSPGSSPRVRGKRDLGVVGAPLARLIPARAGKTAQCSPRGWDRWAHPRACGENVEPMLPRAEAAGSSPRVRGKPSCQIDCAQHHRLIPARAGKTRRARPATVRVPAHPRACGENRVRAVFDTVVVGSSPRVRGKHIHIFPTQHIHRLIRARAGKTSARVASPARSAAHPRACGENDGFHDAVGGELGSSPRVRGKRPHPHRRGHRAGLIPARAGKTVPPSAEPPLGRAHPRACGENGEWGQALDPAHGSSPRVRGKRGGLGAEDHEGRLIPARAGKTGGGRARCTASRAHPRACGENKDSSSTARSRAGSSPRVRGKPVRHRPPPRRQRLIPARAGKTRAGSASPGASQAHPRACGENETATWIAVTMPGSSPRVRGKPLRESAYAV